MSDILTERSGSILRIQLNRPEKKNAMTSDMYVTLAELLNAATEDEQIRVRTEAAVDLAGLAGVICEIVNDDGTMARVPDLIRFCKTHGLVMVTVADLARYRLESELDGSHLAIEC